MPRSSFEKSVETRERIIESAYRLFIENGYSATSMRDIGKHAGVTVGAIYNHFATKESIWQEVLIERHPYHEIISVIKAAQGETVAELAHSAASGLVQTLLKRPDLLNLMFVEIVEFNARHIPDLYRILVPDVIGLSNLLSGKRGRLRDLPMPILVRSFAGLFFSYYITGVLTKGMVGTIDEESLGQVVDLFLYGILAEDDEARKTPPGPPSPGAEAEP